MSKQDYKKDFSIFVFHENLRFARLLKESLSEEGYESHFYSSQDLLLQAVYLTLPHIVVLPFNTNLPKLVADIRQVSKEIMIFVVGDEENHEQMMVLAQRGFCYDFLADPIKNIGIFKHRLNKVVEKWMISLAAEQEQSLSKLFQNHIHDENFVEAQASQPSESIFSQMRAQTTQDELLHFLLERCASIGQVDFVYLQNNTNTENLKLTHLSQGFSQKYQNLGISYANMSPQEKEKFLKDPRDFDEGKDFFQEVFSATPGPVFLIENESQVFGFIIALSKLPNESFRSIGEICSMAAVLLDNMHKSKIIYDYIPLERRTFCYSNRSFYEKSLAEISRARRLSLSLSIATFQISYKNESLNHRLPYLVAKILKRFTRATDTVGRITDDRFSVLLPHTDINNSSKKAASLLKIIEAAIKDKKWQGIEVNCGVSAYPQNCTDSMSLIETSEEACDQANPFEVFVYQSYDSANDLQP